METGGKSKRADLSDAEYDRENVGPQYKRGRLYSTDASIVDLTMPLTAAQRASTRLEYLSELDVFRQPQEISCVRNTGIICTIGPSCNSAQVLVKLIQAGLCIARINLSHVKSVKELVETIANVREAESQVPGKAVAIALDTKGREIRTGREKIEVKEDDELQLSTDEHYEGCGHTKTIYIDYKNIVDIVSSGDQVFIDDGLISLKVTKKNSEKCLSAVVQNGGKIGSHKGVNLPGTKVDLPVLTEKDKEFLQIGVQKGVDMVFVSFVQDKEDVEAVREVLGEDGSHILVISKIENKVGLDNFDEILRANDGIMVARGDLGIEIPPEKVFTAQKMMTGRCNRAGKPVIVATQMLDSMEKKPRPTRAEVNDVANAVLDGADCVMLSGETANGMYPEPTVAMMSKIALEAEATMFHRSVFDEMCKLTPTPTNTVQSTAIAAVNASFQQHAAAIVTVTTTGRTAFVLSQYRPQCPVIAVTRDRHTARICHLHRNVYPLIYNQPVEKEDWLEDMQEKLMAGVEEGKKIGFIKKGSTVVLLSGWIPGPKHINTIRIIMVE